MDVQVTNNGIKIEDMYPEDLLLLIQYLSNSFSPQLRAIGQTAKERLDKIE